MVDVGSGVEVDTGDDRERDRDNRPDRDSPDYDEDHDDGRDPHTGERNGSSTYDREEREREERERRREEHEREREWEKDNRPDREDNSGSSSSSSSSSSTSSSSVTSNKEKVEEEKAKEEAKRKEEERKEAEKNKTLEALNARKGLNTTAELKFGSNEPVGLERIYDDSTFGSEYPDNTRIIGAPNVKVYSDDGTFIGSLNIQVPFRHEESLDPPLNQCDDFQICIPSFSFRDFDWDWLNRVTDESQSTIKHKVIEEINKIADEVDTVPNATNLVRFLSQEYENIPKEILGQLYPDVRALIKSYNLVQIPDKEPEYEDLSAYKNADFPELNLNFKKDDKELSDLLDKLNDLKLEDLEQPIICATNEQLTTKVVDGSGIFDHMASAIFNQLEMVKRKGLITNNEIAQIYSSALVQGIQVASQYALESNNQKLQSYQAKIAAAQASVQLLQTKAQLLLMPSQMRLAYAQLEAQLKQLELLNIQLELEKEKYPQIVAQTDLILAQIDGQRLQNEAQQVGIQQAKLSLVQSQEQIALMQEQNKQAQVQTELSGIQIEQAREQTKSIVLQNNKLIEDTKMVDAQTQHQLKQVELADIQKIQAKAQIKAMAQQIEKEKNNIGLIKAQVATAFAQLSLIKDQMKASRAQYSDTIDGKPIGGLLGAQIAVNKVQASSFERKAFMELLSQAQQGWAANKTTDIAIASPVSFTPIAVDRLVNWGMTKYFNMPEDTLQMPYGYTPYLSDDQMDGKEEVSYKVKDKSNGTNT